MYSLPTNSRLQLAILQILILTDIFMFWEYCGVGIQLIRAILACV